MNLDIKAAVQAFQTELNIGNWFSQIGKPLDPAQHLFAVERVANKAQITALMKAG